MTIQTIGQRMMQARNDKKMSQLKLSQLTNYSQAIISAHENDRVLPSERALKIIAKVLEVKVAWLRYGEGEAEDDVTELERKFNILVKHLKIPPEIFNNNKKEKIPYSTTSKKRGRPLKINK